MNDYRQTFLDEIDYLTSRRNIIHNAMQERPGDQEIFGLVLRMTDSDIARNRKALDHQDGKIPASEFMGWYADHLCVKQLRMTGLRRLVETYRDVYLETPELHRFFETYFQEIKDELLQGAHREEQFSAALEEVDALYPPAKPEHDAHVVFFLRFPIRRVPIPDIGFGIFPDDMVAVMRIINGEISSMAEQPHLNAEQSVEEMKRIVSLFQNTPETRCFREWIRSEFQG